MHKERLDWNHLRTALAVARTGNLSRAARALGINQSTASRHLAGLEHEAEAILFHRSKTAMRITEAGRVVVAEAEAMESAMLRAFDRVARTRADVGGLIRVVAVPWISTEVLTPRLVEFWRHYPSVEVQAIADTRERPLDRGEVDLSLRFDTQRNERIEKIAAAEVTYSIYGASGADPARLPWMGFREDEFRTAVEAWLIKASAGEPVRFWANDATMLLRAVRAGAGKALLPDALVGGDPALARIADHQVARTLWIQVLPETRKLRRVSLYLDWLRTVLDEAFAR